MSEIIFQDWKVEPQSFVFVGWRSDRARISYVEASAFVLDSNARRGVLQLRLPRLEPASYQEDPFPSFPPIRIENFRLLAPPCRATKEQAKRVFDRSLWGIVPEKWEVAYSEVLYLGPSDDAPLRERLNRFRDLSRREYETRKGELATIKDSRKRAKQRAILEEIFNAPMRTLSPNGPAVAGRLHLTLEMVKENNAEGIRDDYLREQWAKEHRFDLRQMDKERDLFLKRYRELTEQIISVAPTAKGALLIKKVQNFAGWHCPEQLLAALVRCRMVVIWR